MLSYIILGLILTAGMLAAFLSGKLTVTAALAGGLTGLLVFFGAGFTGVAMMAAFFILGTAATSWKKTVKKQLHAEEKHHGRRTAAQVLANSGVAAICGLLACFYPAGGNVLGIMIAGALAAAMGDTLSSELGMVYGRSFYNILTLKKDKPGLDGVISLEGTCIGIAGSWVIAMIYGAGFGWSNSLLLIVIAGTAGNLADSVFGAAFERKQYIGNNTVNFLNTLVAAVVAWLLYACCL